MNTNFCGRFRPSVRSRSNQLLRLGVAAGLVLLLLAVTLGCTKEPAPRSTELAASMEEAAAKTLSDQLDTIVSQLDDQGVVIPDDGTVEAGRPLAYYGIEGTPRKLPIDASVGTKPAGVVVPILVDGRPITEVLVDGGEVTVDGLGGWTAADRAIQLLRSAEREYSSVLYVRSYVSFVLGRTADGEEFVVFLDVAPGIDERNLKVDGQQVEFMRQYPGAQAIEAFRGL